MIVGGKDKSKVKINGDINKQYDNIGYISNVSFESNSECIIIHISINSISGILIIVGYKLHRFNLLSCIRRSDSDIIFICNNDDGHWIFKAVK